MGLASCLGIVVRFEDVLKKCPPRLGHCFGNYCMFDRIQYRILGGGNSNIFYFHPYLGK